MDSKEITKVSAISIVINVVLSIVKILAGIVASSTAMISDAIHSMSDVFSTVVVIIGVRLSLKEADEDHPYGHERFECVAAIILSGALFFTGLMIGYQAILSLVTGTWRNFKTPGVFAIIAAIISILVKEGMFWYTKYYAKKNKSSALLADAWHHRSDALSSVGAVIGIAFARHGFLFMDSVAGIIICVFILKAAIDIFKDAISKMVDHSGTPQLEEKMRCEVLHMEGVKEVDSLHSRSFGNKIYVDVEIAVDGNLTLTQAHKIAEDVHDKLEAEYEEIKHIMVHVNPYE